MTGPVYDSYIKAESDANMSGGDTGIRHCVVQDFMERKFIVLSIDEAEQYINDHDAEIQYTSGPSPDE